MNHDRKQYKLLAARMKNMIVDTEGVSRKDAEAFMDELIDKGLITFQYEFETSHLDDDSIQTDPDKCH